MRDGEPFMHSLPDLEPVRLITTRIARPKFHKKDGEPAMFRLEKIFLEYNGDFRNMIQELDGESLVNFEKIMSRTVQGEIEDTLQKLW